ncbi:hypothetical protein MVEG_11416 [Podila verticillata NRRL 6337]|uniref:Uncharacterized protein n=1 Tax=Podila verticillata NRRL 6337 TaxID=1069443 RepID=A0A086TLR5_9FUNG|nr:hypothetical protein MVEG_11416 [Podila verticillata NRRL 6337]
MFQQFRSKDGESLQNVQTHTIGRFGDCFVYWSEIQDAFTDINYLKNRNGERVLFEVVKNGDDYELDTPMRIKPSCHPYTVVLWTPPNEDGSPFMLEDINDLNYWRFNIFSARPSILNLPEFEPTLKHHNWAIADRLQRLYKKIVVPGDRYRLGTPPDVLAVSAPRLFLVLPSDLELWDDADPSTQSFRFYYMCDYDYVYAANRLHPKHIHIFAHEGYDLDRPQEFFRQFGRFALTMLETVRDGCSDKLCHVPDLNSSGILDCCPGIIVLHSLIQDTLQPLVNKSIAYIRGLIPEHNGSPVWMNGTESRLVQTFLRVQKGDNRFGSLFRVQGPFHSRWLCPDHAFEGTRLLPLYVFVRDNQGYISAQEATLAVNLKSPSHLNEFGKVLRHSRHPFDVSINLEWSPSRKEFQTALEIFSATTGRFLQIGTTLDVLHKYPQVYSRDMVVWQLGLNRQVMGQIVTLFNYPRPTEKYVYFSVNAVSVVGLLFDDTGLELDVNWAVVRPKLETYISSGWYTPGKGLHLRLTELSSILEPLFVQGLKGIDFFHEKAKKIQWRLGVKDGAVSGIQEIFTPFYLFHVAKIVIPGLQRVVIRLDLPYSVALLFQFIEDNPGLLSADVHTQQNTLFSAIEDFCSSWPRDSRTFSVTFFEQGLDQNGEVLATLEIETGFIDGRYRQRLDIVNWTCGYIGEAVNDWGAMVLNSATRHTPTALLSLRLDISRLTDHGLESMSKVMEQSNLEQLFIECEAIDPSWEHLVLRILGEIRWSALNSLSLSGGNIDGWVRIWAAYADPLEPFDPEDMVGAWNSPQMEHVRESYVLDEKFVSYFRILTEGCKPSTERLSLGLRLQSLTVRSTGGGSEPLSHASVLFIRNLIDYSSLMDLSLENLELQEKQDWHLLVDAIDFSLLVTFSLFGSNFEEAMVLLEKLDERRTPLEKLDLRSTPADEELRRQFRTMY